MVAAVLAALAFAPAPVFAVPPDPIEPPPETYIFGGPAEGSTVGETTASFSLVSTEDGAAFQCNLDSTGYSACDAEYTTPPLALGAHTLGVRSLGIGGLDRSPATRNWTVAGLPSPTPTPTATPDPDPDPTPEPTASPTPTPTPVAVPSVSSPDRNGILSATTESRSPRIDVSLVYFMNAKRTATRFATLSLKRVTAGATITLTCSGGCPRKRQTLSSVKGGTVALSSFRRKALKTGAKLTIAVSKPGMTGMMKVLTMRADRRPSIVTRTLS